MAGTLTVEKGKLKIAFTYTGDIAVISDIALKAAHNLYDRGLGDPPDENGYRTPFDDLTNAKRLAILDGYIARVCVDLARQYHVSTAVAETTATATEEADGLAL